MSNFTNYVIPPENLPAINEEQFEPVDPRYLRLIYYRIGIFALIMAASLTAFALISHEKLPAYLIWIISGFILVIIIYSLLISKLAFPYRGYLIREKDLSYKKGLITFKLTSIPYTRIQHVELNQGILAKKMGLASIRIFTAGGNSDDLSISGLPVEKAKEIRSFLADMIQTEDAG